MTLRVRLAVTAVILLVPTLVGAGWVQRVARRRAFEESMSQFAFAQMDGNGRATCETWPATWTTTMRGGPPPGPQERAPLDRGPGGPPRGLGPDHDQPPEGPPGDRRGPRGPRGEPRRIQLFAYDTAFESKHPGAPVIDAELRSRLKPSDSAASLQHETEQGPVMDVLVRMPWSEGPCALVLARGERPDIPLLPPLDLFAIPAAATLLALLLSLGPVIRRIRLLTKEVSVSAQHQYSAPITRSGSDEISELGSAFDQARQRIRSDLAEREAREKALRAFLENTTHDVMIPLTVLLGHLSQLRTDLSERGAPEMGTVDEAAREAHYIAALLRNLSTVAKLEAVEARVELSAVNLNALVERCIARHKPIARQKSVELECAVPEEPVVVQADMTLVEQAVSNAIYNAVRYNNEGGHVAVVLSGASKSQPFRIRVMDDGPGIPEAELAKIVERGVRGNDARTRSPEGQGLGMSIAQDVTRLHGWAMKLSKSEFGGLLVEFEGPAPA